MSEKESEHLRLPLLFIFLGLLHLCSGEIGTAGQYAAPYLPTACYGSDLSKFPSSNLFASAGDGIWDNGAACGRQYFVRCLSAHTAGTCKAGQVIKVKIVDRASRSGEILVLSTIAFGAIANPSAAWVNIEFAE
ncbi:EG45-like domain containing protein [Vitis vinifera]|uniref:EG45-like domain containing protein n=1 Tax=Vitis vinifera TaxID=29760 RepID=A0A438F1R4_VITVI|nr:EG45-like domain containing protein [Vitis vinifera]